jgi:3-oxoacyl-[acyl-carrier protein] reductase
MSQLNGKVAVVTGASKGIGAGIASELAARGATVVVNYASSKQGAERVVNEIVSRGGKAVAMQADFSREADIVKLFAETKKQFGKLDILVNNAGVYEFTPLEKLSTENYHKQFNINVLGLLIASREAARLFGDSGGSIINISSAISTAGFPNTSTYAGTKGAVDAITRSLAAELGPRKIRVNSVNPGLVETEGVQAMGVPEEEFKKPVEAATPLGRVGQPRDIAPVVAFLASDEASWITGETYRVSGGFRG